MISGIDLIPGCEEILQRCDSRSYIWDSDVLPDLEEQRPRSRDACASVPRPCPHSACKYHMFFENDPVSGSLRMRPPTILLDSSTCSCALDMAEMRIQSIDEMKYVVGRNPEYLDESHLN
jgi:hypothetical protein